jgi:predicted house-cleaning noncanonical NTP pyrophosphatase (MazG superfamily)
MAKYNSYIELSPGYESVVDETTEQRQDGFWEKYIVHEDMVNAIEYICRTFKPETPDDQRSFWFHGTYGTGKSYSALVIKHLFEDPIDKIEGFMSRSLLWENKERFLSIRRKGKYLVVWKSGGCDSIVNANRLMMEMEHDIRKTLYEKLGDSAYYGRKSLIEAVKDLINDPSINWQSIYNDSAYLIGSDYASVGAFRELVLANDLKACEMAAQVIIKKGWGLFRNVEQFKEWIVDIIQGNNLQKTGIIFIWDEFTEYLKQSKDMNVLQTLSEFCKQQPFYMMFIVHRDSTWVEEFGQESYEHMVHRFHELVFNIDESAAYQLIGDSILMRPAMEDPWRKTQQMLLDSIKNKIPEFVGLDLDNNQDTIKKLFPIHPMTLTLLSKVAGNFAASQRTLFRFLKDPHDSNKEVGFQYYINNFGPDDWRWLTPDFLWDYFFMSDSDVREFGEEAKACYRHYTNNASHITDKRALSIFKAAMLLIAMSGTTRNIYTRQKQNDKKIKPSVNVLINCFVGQLSKEEVEKYIKVLEEELKMLMTIKDGYDYRIERPYDKSGVDDDLEKRKAAEKNKNKPYVLLSDGGLLTEAIKGQFLDSTKAISKRIEVEPCSAETNSLNYRLQELNKKLDKYSYKFGILLVAPKDAEQFQKTQERLKEISEKDDTKRLVIAMLKKPLDEKTLDEWYEYRAHHLMSADAGLAASADQYRRKAEEALASWVTTAIGEQMIAYYNGTLYTPIYGKDDLARKIEKDIVTQVFYAAPEKVVKVSTAYRPSQEKAALAGITKNLEDKNQQLENIVNAVKTAQVWDVSRIEDFTIENVGEATKAIGYLAQFIQKQLAGNTKVNLQEMWEDLQQPPFGYYDSLACAYLLGFVMRFYANTSYYWFDGTNPNILTENNLATMVTRMCKNNVVANVLSAGSETDRRFREYTQKIFELAPNEAANEEQTRKFVRAKVSKVALPFWTIKYIPEEKFGGVELKAAAGKVIDKYTDFIMQTGDQEAVMADILEFSKGKIKLREVLTTLFKDTLLLHAAFREFIVHANPKLNTAVAEAGLAANDLVDSIKSLMQDEVYTWLEEQVIEKLDNLYLDITLISYLNNAFGTNRKSIEKLREDINNKFERMKIPGEVLENMNEPWIDALLSLKYIAQNKWQGWGNEEKNKALSDLRLYAKDAWTNVVDSRIILNKYLKKLGFEHSPEDIEKIYNSLEEVVYNSSEKSFGNAVLAERRKLAYERDKTQLIKLWKEKTGTKSISDWCSKFLTPILWVMPQDKGIIIQILNSIQDDKVVDATLLSNALNLLQNDDFEFLGYVIYINKCFFEHTDDKFAMVINDRLLDVKDYIKSKLGRDVYNWANNVSGVRKLIRSYIKEKMPTEVIVKAQNKIGSMNEKALKNMLNKLMEEDPDLCILILKE